MVTGAAVSLTSFPSPSREEGNPICQSKARALKKTVFLFAVLLLLAAPLQAQAQKNVRAIRGELGMK